MNKVVKLYISPSKGRNKISSWEEKIKENYGPLSGYEKDLKTKSIDDILLEILQLKEEGMVQDQNYFNIRGIYLTHIMSLQKNLKDKNDDLKKEIQTLSATSPSKKTVEILKKYGILTGIEFFIPYSKIYKEYLDLMGEGVFKGTDVEAPYKKYWDKTFQNVNYVPEKEVPFKYSDIKLAAQVLIFSKAKFKLYDVTNFLSNINTTVNLESGGNFKLKMHLVSQKELETEENFQNNNINITGYTKALFLQSVFRENDLVFIRFENLKCENFSNNKKIKGRYWDMIGLIDSLSIMSDYNSMDIDISGRDLIKLIIDDNNFFIPLQWVNNSEKFIRGGDSKTLKRLLVTGEYNLEFTRSYKSIENSVGFILSQLTHIEVLSTDCLDFLENEYGSNLSKQFEYSQAGRETKEAKIKGIWGLINYYVDEKISHLRLADASLKSPDGSTMQQIFKICQAPFVEVIADTFVDKYNLIIRKPPFSIEDISKQNFLVIERGNCIRDTLEFSRDIYTVFQIIPQGSCFANNSSIAQSYIPMVVLDDYCRLWGNKLYSQVYNYIDIDTYWQLDSEEKKEKSKKELYIETLAWIIETIAYLPFSRTGQIVIRGDRRIKVGQWIYYEKTNEVFYVNSVNHSINITNGDINRITILNVSRGLVKDYVKPAKKKRIEFAVVSGEEYKVEGEKVEVSNISYADLVDIDLLKEGLKELGVGDFFKERQTKEGDTFKSNSSLVISEVFNFFLSGKQFEGIISPYTFYYKKSAMTLEEINEEQSRAVSGEASYSMSINAIESSGGISDQNEQNNKKNSLIQQDKKIQRRTPLPNTIKRNDEVKFIFSK